MLGESHEAQARCAQQSRNLDSPQAAVDEDVRQPGGVDRTLRSGRTGAGAGWLVVLHESEML
jgi:hypothetical protein